MKFLYLLPLLILGCGPMEHNDNGEFRIGTTGEDTTGGDGGGAESSDGTGSSGDDDDSGGTGSDDTGLLACPFEQGGSWGFCDDETDPDVCDPHHVCILNTCIPLCETTGCLKELEKMECDPGPLRCFSATGDQSAYSLCFPECHLVGTMWMCDVPGMHCGVLGCEW